MVIESLPPEFSDWLPVATIQWLIAALLFGSLALLGVFLALTIRRGPLAAVDSIARGMLATAGDLFRMSPRRVWALSWLGIKESLSRLVLVAFVVFLVVLLFAAWYLDANSRNPLELYLTFVMTMTSYLVLLLALFLSVFSLPADLAKRTLHTVVTKPVRPSEIIAGRVLGFVITGTGILAATALVSYVFVTRGLGHTHVVLVDDLEPVTPAAGAEDPVVKRGVTQDAQGHHHQVSLTQAGVLRVEDERGHSHEARLSERDGKQQYVLSPPTLPARVPIYGSLIFKDRAGVQTARGINVGDEWTYRQYIEGGTSAAAIWRFRNLDPVEFPEGLSLEMTLQVFRSHKGIISKPIAGAIVLRNPYTGLASEDRYFGAREYYTDTHLIPRNLLDREGNPIDLFTDLVHDGEVLVEVMCVDSQQFLGMAQGDAYLRMPDASFTANFFKGYVGIWLQMVLVICLGVMCSTFLNGPVAMMTTLGLLIAGFSTQYIIRLARGEYFGGGPLEQFMRMVGQRNLTSDLDPGLGTDIALMVDQLLTFGMGQLALLLPSFADLNDVSYVAHGYNIPTNLLLIHVVQSLAYFLPVMLVGYFLFRSREVAR